MYILLVGQASIHEFGTSPRKQAGPTAPASTDPAWLPQFLQLKASIFCALGSYRLTWESMGKVKWDRGCRSHMRGQGCGEMGIIPSNVSWGREGMHNCGSPSGRFSTICAQNFSSPVWIPYLASTASSVPTQSGQGRAQGFNKAQSRPWSYGSHLAESPAGITYWVPGCRTSDTGLPTGAAHPGETGRLWGPFGDCSDFDWDAWERERKLDRSCRKGGDFLCTS